MAIPFSPRQHRQNAAFLRVLARTGNIREAARATALAYGTVQHRRRACPVFRQRCDAAVATAQARLHAAGGAHRPEASRAGPGADPRRTPSPDVLRTAGGEPVVIRRRDGRLQLRRAQPGKLTGEAERAFLLALSATCNIALSAAATGASPRAFARRASRNPGFAREMRLALERGYGRLEAALLESVGPEAHVHDGWRDNEPPAIPPMSVGQAMQLLYLHQKEARLGGTPEPLRRRRSESDEARSLRFQLMVEHRDEQAREAFRIAEAARRDRGEPLWLPQLAHELPPPALPDQPAKPVLPDLSQVTGWSKADPAKVPHDPDVALFGGFRVKHLTKEQVEKGRAKRRGD
ncbi:MAG: hypothetical protein ACRYFW_09720 [Janthinobacterium lividum]